MQIYDNKKNNKIETAEDMRGGKSSNTDYKLLVYIEPKKGQKGDWKITAQKEKGVVKPIDEKFESYEQRSQRYSRLYQIWNRTNDLVVTNQTLLDMEFYPEKSPFNTDVECMYDKKYSSSKSLFQDSKHNKWFTEYWQKTCLNKTECEMDPSYMTTTDDYNMDYDDFD